MLFAIVMAFSISAVSAANTTTVDANSVVKSADTVKNYVETKKAVPTTVTVGSKKVTSAQYLYILSSTVTNLNKNSKKSVTVKTIAKAPKPVENVKTGTLSKSEYIELAGKITTFVNTNGRLPNFITTSKGNMNPDNLIYTYSKIVAFYKTNNRLPNTVSVKSWSTTKSTSEGSPATIDAIFKKAAKFGYGSGISNAEGIERYGRGDCWAMSDYLYKKLKAAKVKARIVQYSTAYTSNHRSVQYYKNGAWFDVPYRTYGFNSMFNNTAASRYGRIIASC